MDAASIAALATAASALLGVALGTWRLTKEMRQRQDELERERQTTVANWKVEMVGEISRRRMNLYPDVFHALSAAVYVRDSQGGHVAIAADDALAMVADDLFRHLYGEPGVIMSPEARAQVHVARLACLRYLAADPEDRGRARVPLIDAFWNARRLLRLDVQALDQSLDGIIAELRQERTETAPSAREGAENLASAPVAIPPRMGANYYERGDSLPISYGTGSMSATGSGGTGSMSAAGSDGTGSMGGTDSMGGSGSYEEPTGAAE